MTRIEKEKKKEAIEFGSYLLQDESAEQRKYVQEEYLEFKRYQSKKRSHNKKGGKE